MASHDATRFTFAQSEPFPNTISYSLLDQVPLLPGELVKYIGKTYNCWHLASSLLEPPASASRPSVSESADTSAPKVPRLTFSCFVVADW